MRNYFARELVESFFVQEVLEGTLFWVVSSDT